MTNHVVCVACIRRGLSKNKNRPPPIMPNPNHKVLSFPRLGLHQDQLPSLLQPYQHKPPLGLGPGLTLLLLSRGPPHATPPSKHRSQRKTPLSAALELLNYSLMKTCTRIPPQGRTTTNAPHTDRSIVLPPSTTTNAPHTDMSIVLPPSMTTRPPHTLSPSRSAPLSVLGTAFLPFATLESLSRTGISPILAVPPRL